MNNEQTTVRIWFVDTNGRDVTGTAKTVNYLFSDFFNRNPFIDVSPFILSNDELAAAYRGPNHDGIGVRWEQTTSLPSRKPRHVTLEVLNEFEDWTRTATTFLTSPEGAILGEELREVINFARKGLALS